MKLRPMDRRIIFAIRSETQNSLGEMIETWPVFATVWAQVKNMAGREKIDANARRADADVQFMILWLADVVPTMRIVFDGRNYDILAIAEIGRRDGLRILANAVID